MTTLMMYYQWQEAVNATDRVNFLTLEVMDTMYNSMPYSVLLLIGEIIQSERSY